MVRNVHGKKWMTIWSSIIDLIKIIIVICSIFSFVLFCFNFNFEKMGALYYFIYGVN